MPSPKASSRLFKPLKVGSASLAHRLVLPPLTRLRATEKVHVPIVPMVADYYAQRASVPGTLLVAEATSVSPQATGSPNSPGIWSKEQIDAWRTVTDAVHAKGSYIYNQLWFVGRAGGEDDLREKGLDVVAPSALRMPPMSEDGPESPMPRALTEQEIERTIEEFAQAARNAIAAGFDGVEIHGANGYLIDEFTQDVTNKREDKWGGSIENRSRLPLAIAKAVADAIGAEKVGYRISPWSEFQGMLMEDYESQFTHLISGLRDLNLGYLHLVTARVKGSSDSGKTADYGWVLKAWNPTKEDARAIVLAGGFNSESAFEVVDKTNPDDNVLVAIGRHWIPNPDLVWRLHEGVDLVRYDRSTFYNAKEERGYTDWAFHPDFQPAVLSQS